MLPTSGKFMVPITTRVIGTIKLPFGTVIVPTLCFFSSFLSNFLTDSIDYEILEQVKIPS